MTARVSHTGKVIVKSKEMLIGKGVRFIGLESNGRFKFLLTQTAYEKISDKCKFE